jgi:hypothetical protein
MRKRFNEINFISVRDRNCNPEVPVLTNIFEGLVSRLDLAYSTDFEECPSGDSTKVFGLKSEAQSFMDDPRIKFFHSGASLYEEVFGLLYYFGFESLSLGQTLICDTQLQWVEYEAFIHRFLNDPKKNIYFIFRTERLSITTFHRLVKLFKNEITRSKTNKRIVLVIKSPTDLPKNPQNPNGPPENLDLTEKDPIIFGANFDEGYTQDYPSSTFEETQKILEMNNILNREDETFYNIRARSNFDAQKNSPPKERLKGVLDIAENVSVIWSNFPGMGKTFYIREQLANLNKTSP